MRHLGLILLIYVGLVADLRTSLWSASGLRPVMLDLVLLAVCAAEHSALAVLYGAVVGCLSAQAMGTHPGLGTITASTAVYLCWAFRTSRHDQRWRSVWAAVPLLMVNCDRALELTTGSDGRLAAGSVLWCVAGNAALTLLAALAVGGIVRLMRGRNLEALA